MIAHYPFVPYDLGGKRLHHLDRVGAHTVAVMEILRHTKDHNIVLFLSKSYIGPLIGLFPRVRLHYSGVSGVDLYLP